jgi:hypothetical protein
MSRVKILDDPPSLQSLTLYHEPWASYARLDEDVVFTLYGTSLSPFVVSRGGWSSCSSIQAAYLYTPFLTQALPTRLQVLTNP